MLLLVFPPDNSQTLFKIAMQTIFTNSDLYQLNNATLSYVKPPLVWPLIITEVL